MGLISFITGSDNRRNVKKLSARAEQVLALEDRFAKMTDEELRGMTEQFKKRYNENFETLDDLLPEAFAVVREAGKRVLNMQHFKVQIMGGIALHQGRIAEMRTGEGKTLVSTLPAYLNALTGRGVHIVTVNDYLARRDAEWMGKIHRFLGLTVGVAVSGMKPDAKRAAYNCDITYGTNNELGFDYLRDNMVVRKQDMVQRDLCFAIIDEVDSILIDEARTPLIISGRGGKSSEMYSRANRFARRLVKDDDYEIDEKKRAINLTEQGIERAETYFEVENLADIENTELYHYINNALKANFIMHRDQDYIVSDGEVVIVDEFTGRLMIGRRYSDGLHQAIEAKENVRIQSENKTLATITFQNYFRLYEKLSGMTGTAKTEENEFRSIYKLDVVTIPTNVPSQRVDENDLLFTTEAGKLRAVIADIKECYERGQPVLVGTTNVEKSEELSKKLRHQKIPHNVLNAKNHEKEAMIVAQAGRLHQVTIATNMAGRGTDIMLGGNAEFMAKEKLKKEGFEEPTIDLAASIFPVKTEEEIKARELYNKYLEEFKAEVAEEKEKVVAFGGLRIIGTERHESRRIDNQLRGRAGRQGDMGSSVFYLSAEDDVLRLWGERLKKVMNFFKVDEDTPLQAKILSRQIENAQRNIEGRNFSVRKSVLEYDNVMNKQREIIYAERGKVLKGMPMHDEIMKIMRGRCEAVVDMYTDPKVDYDEWDSEELNKEIERKLLPEEHEFFTEERLKNYTLDELKDMLYNELKRRYEEKIADAEAHNVNFEDIERYVMLRVVDQRWMDHIDNMDALRSGIGLKAYGQQDPVIAYQQEGFDMFDEMIEHIHEDVTSMLMHANVEYPPEPPKQEVELIENHGSSQERSAKQPEVTPKSERVGRNDPCPCGSGKKYKNCCGKDKND
ncbi:MAG: preprotein translocase subunit SecA [Clostridiales bacterium]|nr:preprotein translocase subunit SecA [Clostridiales bacterium]